jgi:hypothetical protein
MDDGIAGEAQIPAVGDAGLVLFLDQVAEAIDKDGFVGAFNEGAQDDEEDADDGDQEESDDETTHVKTSVGL